MSLSERDISAKHMISVDRAFDPAEEEMRRNPELQGRHDDALDWVVERHVQGIQPRQQPLAYMYIITEYSRVPKKREINKRIYKKKKKKKKNEDENIIKIG